MNFKKQIWHGGKFGLAQAIKTASPTATGFIGTSPFRIQQMLSTRGEIEKLKSKKEDITPKEKKALQLRSGALIPDEIPIAKKEFELTKKGREATEKDIKKVIKNIIPDFDFDFPSFKGLDKSLTKYGIIAIGIIAGIILIQRGGGK